MSDVSRADPLRVSVVMGVHNGAAALAPTLDSVLGQQGVDVEFIIVNDGSSDGSADVLERYATDDSRVHVITQENSGLTSALARAADFARFEFIARQDVGDISLPQRLRVQAQYLQNNPAVVAVGCGARRLGPHGEHLGTHSRHLSPEGVTDDFLRNGKAILHACSMFRRSAYRDCGGYRPAFRYAQDHDLWYRMTEIGMLGECPEVLFDVRIDIGGISAEHLSRQMLLARLAREAYEARAAGRDESAVLYKARAVSQGQSTFGSSTRSSSSQRAASAYFIGSQLYELADARSRTYFCKAIAARPWFAKAWLKLLFSAAHKRGGK